MTSSQPIKHSCTNCRYWSDQTVRSLPDRQLEAMCLSKDGLYARKYTTEHRTCRAWANATLGSIDDLDLEDAEEAYADYDRWYPEKDVIG